MSTHLDEWQVFSVRYGLVNHDNQAWHDKHPWGSRHNRARLDANAKPHSWCRCPGTAVSSVALCGQKITQEDGLCDECRRWCVGIDDAGRYHLLADLPQRTSR